MADNEYTILQGIDYPPNKRAEAGQTVSDLPKEAISWLLKSGIIKPVAPTTPKLAQKSKQVTTKKEVTDGV